MIRIAAICWIVVLIAAAFVVGRGVGMADAGCQLVSAHESAFKTDPDYWGQSMRTLVEACERGEGS